MQCKYRVVVSIDGGGIRGVIPLKIISHIQDVVTGFDKDLDAASWVDLYSATSTGAIISGALMLKGKNGKALHHPKDILNLYVKRGEQIFARMEQGVTGNHHYPLSFVLDHFFGSTTLENLDKHFLFVSYDLNGDEPFYFTDDMNRMRTMTLAKMMTACSAFPGVFPPVKIGHRALADGLIASKNPSKMAYSYAKMFYPNDPIILISLGTGNDQSNEFDLFETEAKKVHRDMENLSRIDDKLLYFRFQPEINHGSPDLNDASKENTEALLQDANAYIHTNDSKFDRLFSLMRIRVEQFY